MLGEGQHTFIKDCRYIYARSASGYNCSLSMNPSFSGNKVAARLAIEECPLALRSFDNDTHRVTGEVSEELEMFLTAQSAMVRSISESYAKAVNAVQAFGTYKKLQAGWPEVLPLVQQFIPIAGQTTALAVSVSDLNIVFKLPVEEKE